MNRTAGSGDSEEQILRGWSQVEDSLEHVGTGLRECARLLRVAVDLAWSPSSRDHRGAGPPDDLALLQQHLRLSDDLGATLPPALLEALTRTAVLSWMLIHLHHDMRLPRSPFDKSFLGLADELARAIGYEMAGSGLVTAAWIDLHARSWRRFQEALSDDAAIGTPEDVLAVGAARLAPLVVPAVSVAAGSDRADVIPALMESLDSLHAAIGLRRDLLRLRSDLLGGGVSPVVGWASRQAGIDPELAPAERVAGAVLLSPATRQVTDVCQARLALSSSVASGLGLENLAARTRRTAAMLADVARLLDGAVQPSLRTGPITTGVTSAPERRDSLEASIGAAGRYLLADPSLRGSWEVHRWGLAGADEVTARFPAGLILEILARHGNHVGPLIDEFSASVLDRRLAYYDHPALPQIETDTLGVLLRLYRWAGDKASHARLINEYLDRLELHMDTDRIPVWLADGDETVLLGEGCGVIAAGVVIGLLDFDPVNRRTRIERSGRWLLDEFIARGPAISVNYPPGYALGVTAAMLARIRSAGLLEDLWAQADAAIAGWIDRQASVRTGAHQGMASLVSACRSAGRTPPQEWVEALLATQQPDGRWLGKPFFFVPHRARSVAWYSSDLLTTALCYDALIAAR